jgi:putative peptidoglycan lipid II flippase
MAATLIYALPYASPWLLPQVPLLQQIAALAALIGLAVAVYFPVAFLIGGAEIGMIRRNLRRTRPKG